MIPQCGEVYARPNGDRVQCTYLVDHPVDKHSWYAMQAQDEAEAGVNDYTPQAVQLFLDAILEGRLDPYIEAILATGHSRKLVLRGVRGFPGLRVHGG